MQYMMKSSVYYPMPQTVSRLYINIQKSLLAVQLQRLTDKPGWFLGNKSSSEKERKREREKEREREREKEREVGNEGERE